MKPVPSDEILVWPPQYRITFIPNFRTTTMNVMVTTYNYDLQFIWYR